MSKAYVRRYSPTLFEVRETALKQRHDSHDAGRPGPVSPCLYNGLVVGGLTYCATDFIIKFNSRNTSPPRLCYCSTSRCPVQLDLPRNLNSSLGTKKSSDSRRLGTLQDRRVRSPPEPPRNDILAFHADMSHRPNRNLQKVHPDKVKKK